MDIGSYLVFPFPKEVPFLSRYASSYASSLSSLYIVGEELLAVIEGLNEIVDMQPFSFIFVDYFISVITLT